MNPDYLVSVIEGLPIVGRALAERRSRLTEHERPEWRLVM